MGPRSILALRSISCGGRLSGFSRIHASDWAKPVLVEDGPVFIALPLYNNCPAFWKSDNKGSLSQAALHPNPLTLWVKLLYVTMSSTQLPLRAMIPMVSSSGTPGGWTGGTMAVANCHSVIGIEL